MLSSSPTEGIPIVISSKFVRAIDTNESRQLLRHSEYEVNQITSRLQSMDSFDFTNTVESTLKRIEQQLVHLNNRRTVFEENQKQMEMKFVTIQDDRLREEAILNETRESDITKNKCAFQSISSDSEKFQDVNNIGFDDLKINDESSSSDTISITKTDPLPVINFSDFEALSSDPFDAAELNTINDMKELESVLQSEGHRNATQQTVVDFEVGEFDPLDTRSDDTLSHFRYDHCNASKTQFSQQVVGGSKSQDFHTSALRRQSLDTLQTCTMSGAIVEPASTSQSTIKSSNSTENIKMPNGSTSSNHESNESSPAMTDPANAKTLTLLKSIKSKRCVQMCLNVCEMGFPLARVVRIADLVGLINAKDVSNKSLRTTALQQQQSSTMSNTLWSNRQSNMINFILYVDNFKSQLDVSGVIDVANFEIIVSKILVCGLLRLSGGDTSVSQTAKQPARHCPDAPPPITIFDSQIINEGEIDVDALKSLVDLFLRMTEFGFHFEKINSAIDKCLVVIVPPPPGASSNGSKSATKAKTSRAAREPPQQRVAKIDEEAVLQTLLTDGSCLRGPT